jgi:hypothetical protein
MLVQSYMLSACINRWCCHNTVKQFISGWYHSLTDSDVCRPTLRPAIWKFLTLPCSISACDILRRALLVNVQIPKSLCPNCPTLDFCYLLQVTCYSQVPLQSYIWLRFSINTKPAGNRCFVITFGKHCGSLWERNFFTQTDNDFCCRHIKYAMQAAS